MLNRSENGQFKAGQSGNPDGRPLGTLTRRKLFESSLTPHAGDIVDKAVSMAKEGNENMLRLLVPMVLPRTITDEMAINLIAAFKDAKTLTEKGNKTFEMMSDGTISLQEGEILTNALGKIQNVTAVELESRLSKLDEIHTVVMQTQQENKELKAKIERLEGKK